MYLVTPHINVEHIKHFEHLCDAVDYAQRLAHIYHSGGVVAKVVGHFTSTTTWKEEPDALSAMTDSP